MLQKITLIFIVAVTALIVTACNSKTITTTTLSNSDSKELTAECDMQKDICKDAYDFQKEYNKMPDKEQRDMKAVLNSYIEHCENAKVACEKSNK